MTTATVISPRPSKKQRELLSFIDGFIKGHGYGPSYREVMRALNYKSVSTVAIHINNLITKGHLIKRERSARSLEVVASPTEFKSPGKPLSSANEKWLAEQINQRFEAYAAKPSKKAADDLFVLVGALHVLGFDEPARAYKSRLAKMTSL